MYFQSYGAVAIVKVNAHWFHVRERGGFSGIFGTMISSGIFLAFTVNNWILSAVAGAVAVANLALTLQLLTRSWMASGIATVGLMLSHTFWSHSADPPHCLMR